MSTRLMQMKPKDIRDIIDKDPKMKEQKDFLERNKKLLDRLGQNIDNPEMYSQLSDELKAIVEEGKRRFPTKTDRFGYNTIKGAEDYSRERRESKGKNTKSKTKGIER